MAFVLEDGTGLSNSNAYISTAFFDSYFSDRGVVVSVSFTNTNKQNSIVVATDYVDQVFGPNLNGRPLLTTQALQFPRACMYRKDFPCVLITGIPIQLQYAVAEYALRDMVTPGSLMPDPITDESGLQVSASYEKIGPIEERKAFLGSAVQTVKPFPKADKWMAYFTFGDGGGSYRA